MPVEPESIELDIMRFRTGGYDHEGPRFLFRELHPAVDTLRKLALTGEPFRVTGQERRFMVIRTATHTEPDGSFVHGFQLAAVKEPEEPQDGDTAFHIFEGRRTGVPCTRCEPEMKRQAAEIECLKARLAETESFLELAAAALCGRGHTSRVTGGSGGEAG